MTEQNSKKMNSILFYFGFAAMAGTTLAIGQDIGVNSENDRSWLIQFSDAVHCTITPEHAQRDICKTDNQGNLTLPAAKP